MRTHDFIAACEELTRGCAAVPSQASLKIQLANAYCGARKYAIARDKLLELHSTYTVQNENPRGDLQQSGVD